MRVHVWTSVEDIRIILFCMQSVEHFWFVAIIALYKHIYIHNCVQQSCSCLFYVLHNFFVFDNRENLLSVVNKKRAVMMQLNISISSFLIFDQYEGD